VPDAAETEILLVDNGFSENPQAGDEFTALGESLFRGRFRYLPQPENLNFSCACNAGARHAQGRYVCFLNNDTLPEPGWLGRLVQALAGDPTLDAVGPLLLYPPPAGDPCGFARQGRVQHLGITLKPDMRLHHLYEFFPAGHRVTRRRRRFSLLTAAALLLERDLFLRLGGFDEAFRNGFEDVELCKRLLEWRRAETPGRPSSLACVPEAVVWHLCGQSPGRNAHESHNRSLLAERGAHAFFHPDEHFFLREDGYELRLSPWLTWQPSLPAERERSLFRSLRKAPEGETARLERLLEAEPYWTAGWDRLVALEPVPEKALALARHAEKFDATPAPLLHIRRLAHRLGDTPLASRAQSALEGCLLSRPERLRRLRALRAVLQARLPELVPEADHVLGGEDGFQRSAFLAFARQVRYGD
jgi:GT2 family glycosyltransferase